jgi:hypothetical protein
MFDLEVFDASMLEHLQLKVWSEANAFSELLSESAATVTKDGHLVLRSKLADPAMRTKAMDTITTMASSHRPELFLAGFPLKVFYCDSLYQGNTLHLDQLDCTDYRHPDVFGNFADQQPGFTTITVVSNKRTLDSLLEKCRSYSSQATRASKSAMYVATSGDAIQVRLSCEELSLEDITDVLVAASFAIKEQRKGKMVLGLSYTEVVTSPKFTRVQVSVEHKFGPFEKI